MQVILETERLFLRKMTMEDFDSLYVVLADSDIMQHYPYSFDEKRVREWIVRNMKRYEENGFGLWAVCLKETGEMIGDCGLTLQNIDGEILPLTFPIVPLKYLAIPVCAVATFAAVQEGHFIRTDPDIK